MKGTNQEKNPACSACLCMKGFFYFGVLQERKSYNSLEISLDFRYFPALQVRESYK
jgi:hypothetical protein